MGGEEESVVFDKDFDVYRVRRKWVKLGVVVGFVVDKDVFYEFVGVKFISVILRVVLIKKNKFVM